MKSKLLKYMSLLVTPILILSIIISLSIKDIPDSLYLNNETKVVSLTDDRSSFLKTDYLSLKANSNAFGVGPIKSVFLKKMENLEVIPGGNSIGVKLSSDGVLVVGFSDVTVNDVRRESPAKLYGVEIGDIITKANGKSIQTSKELIQAVRDSETSTVMLDIVRSGKNITKKVELLQEDKDAYKIGLWVRDSTAGVGTMTFYDEKTGKFGALGHPVTDGDTNQLFQIKGGELLKSSVISVRKGEKGSPGELKGIFQDEDVPLGKIDKNTQCGIFGEGNKEACKVMDAKPMHVAYRDEIKLGNASIITTIDEDGPKEYNIEIVKLIEQNEPGPKSMVIKITDEELLAKTGGIVQGMSGSPIIQNGKIIGAVTHVLINKPDVGYGIYIDWMLEDGGLIK